MAANSEQARAPRMVNSPPTIQSPMRMPGVMTYSAMIDSPKKIAEPIIEPATIVVESKSPKCRRSLCCSLMSRAMRSEKI